MSFKTFGFSKAIMARIRAVNYLVPTPIQQQTMPAILEGRDVMGLARTGTGKTAAFVLPLLQRLSRGKQGQLRALVIAPTRELAEQINQDIRSLGKETGLRSLAVYGGVSCQPQIRALRQGIDIMVACPGHLLDLIRQGVVNLSHLQTLVLDEADHMFDMGFLPDIKRILQYVPARRQTLLFSATMPGDIKQLADKILNNPCYIKIDIEVPLDNISHVLFPVAQSRKTALLLEILKDITAHSILIFTRTKHRAKNLGIQLAKKGYQAISLQGNLSQNRRQEAITGFRKGLYRIMVATDIAARGIDVSQISHVINYDIPDTPDAYTHRIGRTGRAKRRGEAITFQAENDQAIVSGLKRKKGIKLEYRTLQGFAPANNQILQRSREHSSSRPDNRDRSRARRRYRNRTVEAAAV